MNRRRFLAAAGLAGTSILAGCGSLQEQSTRSPPLVENRPDAVYYALDHWERPWVLLVDIDAKEIARERAADAVSDDVDDRLDVDGIESDSDEGLWDPEHVPLSTVLIADDEDVVVTFESGEEQVFWSVGESNTLLALLRSILDVQ